MNLKIHNSNPEVRERARRVAIEFNKTHNIGELQKKSEKWLKALTEGRIGSHVKTEEGKKKISESLKIYYNTQDTDLLITHREKLSKTMRKINGKKISQYTNTGRFIASYDSIVEGAEKNGLTRRNVQACVSGRTKTAGGFIWKYIESKDALSTIEQNQTIGSH